MVWAGPVMAQPKWLAMARPSFVFENKTKKKSKKFQKSFKKIVIFSNIFLFILHNIRLYIYTVKYKSNIKVPGFLQNFSKKKFKTFFLKKYFVAYGQILKFFQAYFS
jgi:hypothetical protein